MVLEDRTVGVIAAGEDDASPRADSQTPLVLAIQCDDAGLLTIDKDFLEYP